MKQVSTKRERLRKEKGSMELIVVCLLGALILVLAIPFIRSIGTKVETNLSNVNTAI